MNEQIEINVDSRLRALVPKFMKRRAEELAQMKAALAAADLAQLQSLGHVLRGSSGGYGFTALGEMGRRLEAAAKSGEREALAPLVAEIEDHLARARVRYV